MLEVVLVDVVITLRLWCLGLRVPEARAEAI